MKYLICISLLMMGSARIVSSQIATGGSYTIEQQVFGNGGSSNASSGGAYSVAGTVGQSIAGIQSNSANYSVHGGFWQSAFTPTAAPVSVSGRVIRADGVGIGGVRLTLFDTLGREYQTISNLFGYFQFSDVASGQTYILSAASKQYQFGARAVTVDDIVDDLTVTADP